MGLFFLRILEIRRRLALPNKLHLKKKQRKRKKRNALLRVHTKYISITAL